MDTEEVSEEQQEQPALPETPAPPVTNRFLFVDIAAQRAKQLRRGARPRLDNGSPESPVARPEIPRKAERIAMEEVRQGLVHYELPPPKSPPGAEVA